MTNDEASSPTSIKQSKPGTSCSSVPSNDTECSTTTATPTYSVGYGKPPQDTKFQKGKSGNPAGRPKKTLRPTELIQPLDPIKVIASELQKPITVVESGKHVKMSVMQALVKKSLSNALKSEKGLEKILASIIKNVPKAAFIPDGAVATYQSKESIAALEQFLKEASEYEISDKQDDEPFDGEITDPDLF